MKNKKLLIILISVMAAMAVLTVTVWAATAKPDKVDDKPIFEKVQDAGEEKENIPSEVEDIQVDEEVFDEEIIEEQPANEEAVTETPQTPTEDVEETDEDVVVDETALKDKEVQEEIAIYDPVNAGKFKYNRQETVNGKTYDLTFSRVNGFANSKRAKVTYYSANYDGFIYYSDTGELYYMSLITSLDLTAENGIDIKEAEKIAYDYASDKCNLEDYTIYTVKEYQKGYYISYSKEMFGFEVSDFINIIVGYDGKIVGIENGIGNFDGVEIDPEIVKSKIAEITEEYMSKPYHKVDGHLISLREGKPVLLSKIIHEDEMGGRCAFIITSELE